MARMTLPRVSPAKSRARCEEEVRGRDGARGAAGRGEVERRGAVRGRGARRLRRRGGQHVHQHRRAPVERDDHGRREQLEERR